MRNPMRGLAALLLGALLIAGCEREQPKAHEATPVGAKEQVPTLRRPEPRPPVLDAGAHVRPPTLPPAQGLGTADGGAAAPTGATDAGTPGDTWTAGMVKQSGAGTGAVLLSGVRAARQAGFDRVVFEFAGDALPGFHLEYVDKPVIRCGSGEPTQVAGQGWLQVRLTGAEAHTKEGKPTAPPRERKVRLGVLRELEQTCDFEGEVTWVLGVQKPNRYRVLQLKAPSRLVVDVQQ